MKISIITASYNYENYIKETIESVLKQSVSDWEYIIVDDCSSDKSVEIIKSFKDKRIKLFVNQENLGLKQTLLRGISEANGEWIVFLESDDVLKPDYLEKKIKVAEKYPQVGIIFNNVEAFGEEIPECILKKTHNSLIRKTYPANIFKNLNIHNKILTFSSVMVRKSILLPEYFNTPLDKLLDWWLYIHLTYNNDVYYLPEKLTGWRFHKDSYIKKRGAKLHFVQILAYYDVYKKNKNLKLLIFIFVSLILSFCFKVMVNIVRVIK